MKDDEYISEQQLVQEIVSNYGIKVTDDNLTPSMIIGEWLK